MRNKIIQVIFTALLILINLGSVRSAIALVYIQIDIGQGINVININNEHHVKISRREIDKIDNFRQIVNQGKIKDFDSIIPDIKVNFIDIFLQQMGTVTIQIPDGRYEKVVQVVEGISTIVVIQYGKSIIKLHFKISPIYHAFQCPIQNLYTPCIYLQSSDISNQKKIQCEKCLICQNTIPLSTAQEASKIDIQQLSNMIKKCIIKNSGHPVVRKLVQQQQSKKQNNQPIQQSDHYNISQNIFKFLGIVIFLVIILTKYNRQNRKEPLHQI